MTNSTLSISCGNCYDLVTNDDWCGYGGHDLNELFRDRLPENEKYRCCYCLSELTGACCCCPN